MGNFDGIEVRKDKQKAFFHFQESAETKNSDRIGVEKNQQKAFIYCQESAEMGYRFV